MEAQEIGCALPQCSDPRLDDRRGFGRLIRHHRSHLDDGKEDEPLSSARRR
jgi:hypothetical protein